MIARLDHVTVRFGGQVVLSDVSFMIREHERIVVLGPSGSGKSTLLAVIAHHLRPTSGLAWLAPSTAPGRFRRKALPAWVPQVPLVLPGRTTLDNALIGAWLRDGVAGVAATAEAEHLLEQVGLIGLSRRNASVLSGGELQRLAVVRALLAKSQLIIADEPTASLDQASSHSVMHALLANKAGPAVLIATHDPSVAPLCDRVVRIVDGALYETGEE